jgi:hypothetical protein
MAYCIPLLWKRLPSDMNKHMCIVARGGFPELGVELIVPHCKTVLLQTCQQHWVGYFLMGELCLLFGDM